MEDQADLPNCSCAPVVGDVQRESFGKVEVDGETTRQDFAFAKNVLTVEGLECRDEEQLVEHIS